MYTFMSVHVMSNGTDNGCHVCVCGRPLKERIYSALSAALTSSVGPWLSCALSGRVKVICHTALCLGADGTVVGARKRHITV